MQLNQYRVSSGLKYFNIYIQSITVFPEGYDRISCKPNIACRGYIFKSGYEMIKAGHITRVVSKLSRVGNVSVTDQILRPMLSPTTSTTSTWNYTFLVIYYNFYNKYYTMEHKQRQSYSINQDQEIVEIYLIRSKMF